jgi:hypothetical protein
VWRAGQGGRNTSFAKAARNSLLAGLKPVAYDALCCGEVVETQNYKARQPGAPYALSLPRLAAPTRHPPDKPRKPERVLFRLTPWPLEATAYRRRRAEQRGGLPPALGWADLEAALSAWQIPDMPSVAPGGGTRTTPP